MLYSEKELEKRLKAGCALYYFYASDEALVHTAAQKTLKYLNRDDPETTVLDGPTPSVEEIVLAAGTISFFGGKRLVLMPLIRPSTYSDKDLQELCDTLADTENAIFVLTSIIEESYGKLRPGKREQKLIAACEKLGYCVQITKPGRAALQEMARSWANECGAQFAKGAEAALLDRCGEDQFLLKNEIDKLAALSGYGTVTAEHDNEIHRRGEIRSELEPREKHLHMGAPFPEPLADGFPESRGCGHAGLDDNKDISDRFFAHVSLPIPPGVRGQAERTEVSSACAAVDARHSCLIVSMRRIS